MNNGQHHAIPMRNHRILAQLRSGTAVEEVADAADLTVGHIAHIARESQYLPQFAPPDDGALSERDQFIVGRALEGETFTAIARDYGISRERVRQIVRERVGLDARTGLAAERAKRRVAAATSRAHALMTAWPDATAPEVADACGLDPAHVRKLMGKDEVLRRQRPRQVEPDVTEAELLVEMRRVSALPGGSPFNSSFYDQNRAEGSLGSVRIIQRHGSWRTACAEAGVEANKPPRTSYTRKWTNDDMLSWVSRYLDSTDCPSYARFSAWLQGQSGAPSAQTVRNYVGNWTAILHSTVEYRQRIRG